MREGLVGAEVTNLTVIVEKTGSDQSPMGATHRSSCLSFNLHLWHNCHSQSEPLPFGVLVTFDSQVIDVMLFQTNSLLKACSEDCQTNPCTN